MRVILNFTSEDKSTSTTESWPDEDTEASTPESSPEDIEDSTTESSPEDIEASRTASSPEDTEASTASLRWAVKLSVQLKLSLSLIVMS